MKKRVQLHAKDVMCYQENEEYYLNRFPKRAKTEDMVYYFQKIDGVIIKTEITVEQWKELYLFNKRLYRSNLKHYDDRYFARFPIYQDEDGDESDPMEYQADVDEFIAKIKRYLNVNELTRAMSVELIERVIIGATPKDKNAPRKIQIVYKVDLVQTE